MTHETAAPDSEIRYINRFNTQGADTVFIHSRRMAGQDGVSTLELGTTHLSGTDVAPEDGGPILMPTARQVILADQSRLEPSGDHPPLSNHIESENLEDFVEQARLRIETVAKMMGSRAMLKSRLVLAEKKAPAWAHGTSGLLIPNPDADRFQGYVATVDEIEAMRSINGYADTLFSVHNHELAVSDDEPSTGFYL